MWISKVRHKSTWFVRYENKYLPKFTFSLLFTVCRTWQTYTTPFSDHQPGHCHVFDNFQILCASNHRAMGRSSHRNLMQNDDLYAYIHIHDQNMGHENRNFFLSSPHSIQHRYFIIRLWRSQKSKNDRKRSSLRKVRPKNTTSSILHELSSMHGHHHEISNFRCRHLQTPNYHRFKVPSMRFKWH